MPRKLKNRKVMATCTVCERQVQVTLRGWKIVRHKPCGCRRTALRIPPSALLESERGKT